MTEIEVGKLYKTIYDGLLECVKVEKGVTEFVRVTPHYSIATNEVVYLNKDLDGKIERKATLGDVADALNDSLEAIKSLNQTIEEEEKVLEELKGWTQKL